MNMDDFTDADINKMMESIIITGLAENAHLTGLTIDKAHLIIPPLLKSLSAECTIDTVKEFIKRANAKHV